MLEALSAVVFWLRDRRKTDTPVATERRRVMMTPAKAQKQLLESVDRLQSAVKKHCEHK